MVLDGPATVVATNPVLKLYDAHLKSRGIRAHTIPDELSQRRELHISIVDSHLNAEGNRVLADDLFAYLLPLLPPRGVPGVVVSGAK